MSGYSPILELGDDPLTPREKVAEAIERFAAEMGDIVGNETGYADAILTALASGSGDHEELDDASIRLASIELSDGGCGYCDALMDVYASQPRKKFYDDVRTILAENAALRVLADDAAKHSMRQTDKLLAEHDRATEAERKLAEAVGLLRGLLPETPRNPIDGELPTFEQCEAARTFLSKEAGRG